MLRIGDIKGAFLESDRLQRPAGPRLMEQPPGGIPGVEPGALIELLVPSDGLNDAPRRWYLKFLRAKPGLGLAEVQAGPMSFLQVEWPV